MSVWQRIRRLFSGGTETPPSESFGILVLGDAGTGKSTLINGLLEDNAAIVHHSPLQEEAPTIICHSGKIHGVPVNLYELPSLLSDSVIKQELQRLKKSQRAHAFVCCIAMSGARLRRSVIDALEGYQGIGLDWSKTAVALTFADCISVPRERRQNTDGLSHYFAEQLTQWQRELRTVVERVTVSRDVAEKMNAYPTAGDTDNLLPNGQPWLVPLQLGLVQLLPKDAMTYILETYQGNLSDRSMASYQSFHPSSSTSETWEKLQLDKSGHEHTHISTASLPTAHSTFEGCENAHISTGSLPKSIHILAPHSPTSPSGRHNESTSVLATHSSTSNSEHHSDMTASTALLDDQTQFWQSIQGILSRLKEGCPIFGILLIGETGSGKSTLINNLLGREVAPVGHTMESMTRDVAPLELAVEGVPVVVYDTPGLDDSRGKEYDKKHLEIMKSLLARGKIHLVIYCWKMTENRMRTGLIRTFEEYHNIGVPWKQTVIALTFADVMIAIDSLLTEKRARLTKILVEKAGLSESTAKSIKMYPTTAHPRELLPNGCPWYVPFWLNVQEILIPAAMARFLDLHKDNICDESALAGNQPSTGQLQISLTKEYIAQFAKTFAASTVDSKAEQDRVIEVVSLSVSASIRKMLSEVD